MPLNPESLQGLFSSKAVAENMPSISLIIHEIERLTADQRLRIQEMANIVRRDQSLAVRVLRMANSSYYAPAEPIMEVEEALIYLGLGQVRSSILTVRCLEKTCKIRTDLLSWREFWIHAIAVGHISRILAGHLEDPELPMEAYYVVGLLHDIGKLVLAFVKPGLLDEILRESLERQVQTSVVEVEHFGIDHGTMGGWYLQRQGIPSRIIEPIRMHHAWSLCPDHPLPCLVSLADLIAHHLGLAKSGSIFPANMDPYQSPEWKNYLQHAQWAAERKDLEEAIPSLVEEVPALATSWFEGEAKS